MKFIALLASVALLTVATPSLAAISDVDHPDVPNCTVFGPNVEGCETLTMNAVYPPNGLICGLNAKKVVDPVTLAVTYEQTRSCH